MSAWFRGVFSAFAPTAPEPDRGMVLDKAMRNSPPLELCNRRTASTQPRVIRSMSNIVKNLHSHRYWEKCPKHYMQKRR